MEYAGVTLRDLYKKGHHTFSEDDICFIAVELLKDIEFVHS